MRRNPTTPAHAGVKSASIIVRRAGVGRNGPPQIFFFFYVLHGFCLIRNGLFSRQCRSILLPVLCYALWLWARRPARLRESGVGDRPGVQAGSVQVVKIPSRALTSTRAERYTLAMYLVNPLTGEIRCETLDEALAVAAAIAGRTFATPALKAQPQAGTATIETERRQRITAQALAFLLAIQSAGNEGIGGKKLAEKIGCSGITGIGTVVQNVNRFLMAAKLSFGDVAVKKRVGNEKLWVPAKHITAGVKALEEKATELA